MTTNGIYQLTSEALIDKSGDPYMPEDVFNQLCNNAIGVLCGQWYEDFQKTQDLSDKAAPLVNPFTLNNVTQIIPATDLSGYWHILPMQGLSVYSCNGISKSEWRPITPIKFKEWATIDSDPFNKPSERNLYYAESKNLISLLTPGGVAINVRGDYLKYPNLLDVTARPNEVVQFTDDVCNEIARMTVTQYWLTLGRGDNTQIQAALNQSDRQPYIQNGGR